ncbi:MAG: type II toxin-antitoxin system prevent-host-death family antitoxin [Deltaproteobacteria bacterium]|jgi:antitoxin (DNA-binding transcriptional repressor) of toxin-antitoxin stability system|nr:type II toxin-antitoxin system prevent-host-death family antitoxin [Deltaproteobacteria bacterium]MBI2535275.1 type II toxin-antitoxin system prevent-host-death family antitoxin [Deltaproteobacteria bacterium]
MITAGIREVKNRLSEYLRMVKAGERVVVTEHGKPVAVMTRPVGPVDERIDGMIRERQAHWEGGKPRGSKRPPKIKGPSVADAVIEDRR